MHLLIAFILGVTAGIFSGLLGIGGGTIIIPGLVYIFGFSQHDAQGTSLAALLLPVGLLGMLRYYKAGHVHLLTGLLIAAGLFVGAYFGADIAEKIHDITLRRIFGVFFLILAVKMLLGK